MTANISGFLGNFRGVMALVLKQKRINMTRNRTCQILHGIAPSVLPENEEKIVLQYLVPKGKRGITEQVANEIVCFFLGFFLHCLTLRMRSTKNIWARRHKREEKCGKRCDSVLHFWEFFAHCLAPWIRCKH